MHGCIRCTDSGWLRTVSFLSVMTVIWRDNVGWCVNLAPPAAANVVNPSLIIIAEDIRQFSGRSWRLPSECQTDEWGHALLWYWFHDKAFPHLFNWQCVKRTSGLPFFETCSPWMPRNSLTICNQKNVACTGEDVLSRFFLRFVNQKKSQKKCLLPIQEFTERSKFASWVGENRFVMKLLFPDKAFFTHRIGIRSADDQLAAHRGHHLETSSLYDIDSKLCRLKGHGLLFESIISTMYLI